MNKIYPFFFLVISILFASACNATVHNKPAVVSSGYLAEHEVMVEHRNSGARESIVEENTRPAVEQASPLVKAIMLSPETAAGTSVADDNRPSASPLSSGSPSFQPLISYFHANVEEADPGDRITLEWSASQALTVTLWHLMPTGQLGQWWDVPPIGSIEYDIKPQEKNSTVFALFAGAEGDLSEMASVTVVLHCMDSWFFESAPDICPAGPALASAGAVQWFKGGVMIWVAEEDQIYVLFDDDNSPGWNRYIDQWDDGEPEYDPTISTPNGLFQPVRGFGLVWRREPGVRDRLGWAIGEESGFETAVQRTSYAKYNETNILAQDGGIWRLLPERSAWEKGAAP